MSKRKNTTNLGLTYFKGELDGWAEENGRFRLPIEFNNVLETLKEDRLTITRSIVDPEGSRSLEAHPTKRWRDYEKRVKETLLPKMDEKTRYYVNNFYLNSASEVAIGSQGRALLPASKRLYLGLDDGKGKNVTSDLLIFVGCGSFFRIYRSEDYFKTCKELGKGFDGSGLIGLQETMKTELEND